MLTIQRAIVGIDSRTTIDLDNTIKDLKVSKENIKEIFEEIQENQNMIKQWAVYKNKFNYASEIEFIDICSTVRNILEGIF